jgi:DNA-binding MarR family transcriptional regulator
VDELSRPPTLLELPSYLAGAVARVGHRLLVEALAEHDLRLPHFAVMAALGDFGPAPQHELADRLAMNRSHLVGYLDEVERRGYVRRERDPADRRRQQVTLTPAGRAQVKRLREVARRSQDAFLDTLSPAERDTLVALLRRVVEAADRDRVGTPEAEGGPW